MRHLLTTPRRPLHPPRAIVLTKGVTYDAHEFKDADWFESQFKQITDLEGSYAPWTFGETRDEHSAKRAAAAKG